MEFLLNLLVIFGTIFLVRQLLTHGFNQPIKRCDKVHKWIYNQNGRLQCDICKMFPFDEEN